MKRSAELSDRTDELLKEQPHVPADLARHAEDLAQHRGELAELRERVARERNEKKA